MIFSRISGLSKLLLLCFILIPRLNAVDFDRDGLDDAWEVDHGYTPNGYAYPNLMLWLQMDRNTEINVIDRSMNQLTSQLISFAPDPFVPGLLSEALLFDLSSSIHFESNNALNVANGFTISAWFWSNNHTTITAVARWSDVNSNSWELTVDADGVAGVTFVDTSLTIQTAKGDLQAIDVKDAGWHHIAVTYENNLANIYVDGTLESSVPINNWSPSQIQSFEIGSTSESASNDCFMLDEVRLYNTALSADEILQLPVTFSDIDGDGLSTIQEFQLGTDPNRADTDGDGLMDNVDPHVLIPDVLTVTDHLKLWLKSDAGIAVDTQNHISVWADQSDSRNDAVQVKEINKPLLIPNTFNGKPVVKFDGINDFLVAPSILWVNNDYSYFVVWKKDGNSKKYHSILTRAQSLTSGQGLFQLLSLNGVCRAKAEAPGTKADALSAASFGNTDCVIVGVTRADKVLNGTKLYFNGILEGQSVASIITTPVSAVGQYFIGGWNAARANASVAEILVYDRALTTDEVLSVHSYLNQRYIGSVDSDQDGLLDSWEQQYFGNLRQDPNGDFDYDGLTNLQEFTLSANPTQADTDRDGIVDGIEILQGRSPTKGVIPDNGSINLKVFTPFE